MPNGNRKLSPPVIVCAAVRNQKGIIVPGPRHFDETMVKVLDCLEDGCDAEKWQQGFIDQHGQFYSREEAWDLAEANQQIVRELPVTGKLYSEHLY
jgi:hypothetical protein